MRCLLIAFASVILLWSETPAPHRIAFTRVAVQAGQPQLFIAASDGSDEHPLLPASAADAYANYDAVWAPDGKSMVFTSERNGSADLFRVNPDGSGVEALTTDPAYDDQAAFSPNGRQLVFVSSRAGGTASLWTLDLKTLQPKRLTSGPGGDYRPSWSPDGKWIAFASGRANPFAFGKGRWERSQMADIYIVRADGSGLKKITTSGSFYGSPKWMPDSRHVMAYYMTAQQTMTNRLSKPLPGNDTRIVSIDATTGASVDLPSGPGVKINPSPLAANEIGYIRKDPDEPGIWYSSGRRGPGGAIRTASWSPDGSHVVFHKRVPGPSAPLSKTFSRNPKYELNLAAGAIPAFSPSGAQFVTTGRPSANRTLSALRVTTISTGETRVVYQDNKRNILAGAWSPAGDKIIFGVGEFTAFFGAFNPVFLKPGDRVDGGAQVAIVNADGTGFQELTSTAGNNAFPSFSPDGKRFVYRAFSNAGDGLRIMNLETHAVKNLTSGYDNFPLWSPRGDLIMFCRLAADAYDVYTIKPDGTSLKRLTFSKGNDAHMSWSPDGEYIAFTSSRMGFKDEVVYTDAPQPYGEIFVMRYDGSGVEQLTDNQWEDGAPGWQTVPSTQVASSR